MCGIFAYIRYFGQITVAFLSSRIEQTESKLSLLLRQGWNLGGLMDVETGDVSGLHEKLICSFKLATDVVWGGVR